MLKNKLIDGIIKEPLGGAHSDRKSIYKEVKKVLSKTINKLIKIDTKTLIDQRIEKFCGMGKTK